MTALRALSCVEEQHADVDARDDSGTLGRVVSTARTSALALAARAGKWPMVRMLVKAGASMLVADEGLQVPLLVSNVVQCTAEAKLEEPPRQTTRHGSTKAVSFWALCILSQDAGEARGTVS
eukprot:2529888-Amphidinium_carterae.1